MYSPFFFTAPATPQLYTLSLHDALPISSRASLRSDSDSPRPSRVMSPSTTRKLSGVAPVFPTMCATSLRARSKARSEEHTSELQSPYDLVCRLLLEKKNKKQQTYTY